MHGQTISLSEDIQVVQFFHVVYVLDVQSLLLIIALTELYGRATVTQRILYVCYSQQHLT